MYYGNTTLIPIPETSDKGKVVVAGSGYVYLQLGYQWDPDKRQPRYERKTIGKVDKKKTGMMYFSPEYERVFGVVDKEVEELKKKYGARELKLAGKFNWAHLKIAEIIDYSGGMIYNTSGIIFGGVLPWMKKNGKMLVRMRKRLLVTSATITTANLQNESETSTPSPNVNVYSFLKR